MEASREEKSSGIIRETVEEIAEAPFLDEFSDYLERIRRNLLIVSFLACCYVLSGLTFKGEGSLLGFKYQNFNPVFIDYAFITALIYFLFHFVLAAWDHIWRWRIRLSGLNLTVTNTEIGGPKEIENLKEKSLYSYWLNQAEIINKQRTWFGEMKIEVEGMLDEIKQACQHDDNQERYHKIQSHLHRIPAKLDYLRGTDQNNASIYLNEKELDKRLKRFDTWFWWYQRWTRWRWVLAEMTVPILVGAMALILLFLKLNSHPFISQIGQWF